MGARAAARVDIKPSHLDIVKITINIIFPTIFVGIFRVCINSLVNLVHANRFYVSRRCVLTP